MSYCYSNDGQSMRAVDPDYQSQPGEVVFDHYATDSELDAAFPGRVGLRLINLRTSRLGDINAHAAKLLATLSANYPEGEVQSWSQQTKEADALAANPDAPTPLLSAIATARGLSVGIWPCGCTPRQMLTRAPVAKSSVSARRWRMHCWLSI